MLLCKPPRSRQAGPERRDGSRRLSLTGSGHWPFAPEDAGAIPNLPLAASSRPSRSASASPRAVTCARNPQQGLVCASHAMCLVIRWLLRRRSTKRTPAEQGIGDIYRGKGGCPGIQGQLPNQDEAAEALGPRRATSWLHGAAARGGGGQMSVLAPRERQSKRRHSGLRSCQPRAEASAARCPQGN